MDLSIVTTLYRSETFVEAFYHRICVAASAITSDFEVIFVNDGSPDGSLDVAVNLFQRDPRVRVIDLSRNFGHHRAIMTGLAHARGARVFLIDSDLEEDPALLADFWERLEATGADVIYGTQVSRKGGLWERISGNLFYWVFKRLSSAPVPKNLVTVRLMSRRYVEALVLHRDREIFLAGLWQITGFRQIGLPITKLCKGSSTYNFRNRVAVFVNAVTSFSVKPLVYIFYLGLSVFLASSAAALYLIFEKLFFGTFLFGWPSLIISIWMIGGITIFCIGIIGIYLSKVFMETKDRPYSVIREIYDRSEEQGKEQHAHQFRTARGPLLY